MAKRQLSRLSPKSFLIGLVLVLAMWLGLDNASFNRLATVIDNNQPGFYSVTSFIDGDTLEINMDGQIERIRFIGLDTPEKNHPNKPVQCFAEAASQHLKELVGSSPVRLEADPTNQNRDRYDRLLRYVYLPDGTLLNSRQIADGFGFAYTAFPFEKMDEFRLLENIARQSAIGLWRDCDINIDNGYINTAPV